MVVADVAKSRIRLSLLLLFAAALALLLASCGENESAVVEQPYVSETDIVINEVLPSNTESFQAFDGRYYDWVELYNPSDREYPLDKYYISDSQESPYKCSLSGQTVPANGYLIVYCSGLNITDERGFLHTNFKLSASKGETVYLSDEHGISSLTIPECEPNKSYGLIDGKPMRLENPTPGAANDKGTLQNGTGVVINEFMTSNTYTLYDCEGDYGDWIELYNTTNRSIDLDGYSITDDPKKPYAFVFSKDTFIPANGYLLIFCDGKNKTDAQGMIHTGFSLGTLDEKLTLFAPDRTVTDSVEIPNMPDNISCGRVKDENNFRFFARPTPGEPNNTPWTKLSADLKPDINDGVLISEVMSASSSKKNDFVNDYIEIYNSTDSDVNLKGYAISQIPGDPFFTFPDVTLKSGKYLVIFCDGTTNLSPKELHAPVKISTGGERFYLINSSGRVCDDFASGKCRYGMSSGRIGNDTSQRVFFATPTPGKANKGQHYSAYTPVPSVNKKGGLVNSGTSIKLSAPDGCVIYYTLDGSKPNTDSKVYNNKNDKIVIEENTVLRAVALKDGCAISDCTTQTYFIDNPHSLPIVCVSGSPGTLTGSIGILTAKENFSEYPVHVEYFDRACQKAVEFDCGARHVGKNSLLRDQKALKLMLREIYGQKTVSYNFFYDCKGAPTTFSSLLLRASGQDQDVGKMRDAFVAALLRGQNITDYQEFCPCALYINAQYWGLYYIREPLNDGYILNHYGLERGSYDLIRAQSVAQEGSINEYNELTKYCEKNDLTDPECYNYICSVVDIDSLINFWVIETYLCNPDTGNIRCFKSKDGKWKWIPFDFDVCMYNVSMTKYNYIKLYLLNPEGHGFGRENNAIIRNLLKNPDFRDRFLTLYCWHIRHTFAPERTLSILDQFTSNIDGEIKLNYERWKYPTYNYWKRTGPDALREFLKAMPDAAMLQLKTSFNLSQEELEAYFTDTSPLNP